MQEDELKPEEAPVEEPKEETPAEAPEASPEEPPQEPEQPEGQEETPAEEEKPPSRRESLRIQQLLEQNKELKAAAAPKGLDYAKDLEAEPDVLKRITEDIDAKTQTAYNDGLQQSMFRTRLDIDAPRVESKYAQLDPKSPDFHPAIADALNRAYMSAAGYDQTTGRASNPNLRYADYIEAQFELADEIAGNRTEETSKNIAKQAAQTGLRPDGSQTKRLNLNKAPEDMTDEELAAVIAQAGVQTGKPRK